MTRNPVAVALWTAALLLTPVWVWAQAPQPPAPAPAAAEEKKEEKPKTYWEEHVLFGYIENSWVFNLGREGRHDVNELRYYDFDQGYTFNMAEFSIKKDPSDRYPWGYGLVVTAGLDAQKNHAIGIFRGDNDNFPFRNTPWVDLQEAYVSGKIPLGTGLTIKAGKFVTLIGYEVIESPNNLNFSRSNLFVLSSPLTHVGMLASYAPTSWLNLTAGPVVGWDVADDNNDTMSYTGQIAVTPFEGLSTNLNWIVGKEFNFDGNGQLRNGLGPRWVLDFVGNYTGIKGLTLGVNVDYGHEDDEAFLRTTVQTRKNNDATWWGWAGYAAYEWTDWLKTALRLEYFDDQAGARTGAGQRVELWDVTATVQAKIWRGLNARVEYRHDSSDTKVFNVRRDRDSGSYAPTAKQMDTITLSLYYLFF